MSQTDNAPHSVARRGLRDQVYESLLDLVLSGGVSQGERIGIDSLAAKIGVSPTPMREALIQLERTGLVVKEGFKGYRVAEPLNRQQMIDLLDVREMLEVQATRWVAPSVSSLTCKLRTTHAHHVRTAAEVSERLKHESADMRAFRSYFAADEAFHRVIFEATENQLLLQFSEELHAHLHRMRQSVLHGDYDMDQAVAEHASILAAAEKGEPDRFVAAMQNHMAGVRARSLKDD